MKNDYEIFKEAMGDLGFKIQLYAMYDSQPNGVSEVTEEQAIVLNQKGYGIFCTVNDFAGARKKENLVSIRFVAPDIDRKTQEVYDLIERGPVYATFVVETKNGYQPWYGVTDATVNDFESIMADRLIPYFGADKNAKDVCRILRVPGFLHWKDLNDPFMIKLIWRNRATYTVEILEYAFENENESNQDISKKKEMRSYLRDSEADDLFDRIYSMDCMAALDRLSGKDAVLGEVYTFKKNSNGNFNIYVNRKSSPNFIDKNMRIGSITGGGPTIFQWIKWFGRSNKQVMEIMREEFPELWQD